MSTASLPASLVAAYAERFRVSRELYERSRQLFPNGVTHDARYLEPFPPYVEHAQGSRKWTVEGEELIDWWAGHGALMLGHSDPDVVAAVQRQMTRGTHPGACHRLEIEWAELVQKLVPSAERLRFTSSGTEATMMALRLARMFTGKPKVLKFYAHFHGWNDFLIQGADPPFARAVPGLLPEVREDTVLVPPNDIDAVRAALDRDPAIGCVILEPTGGHYGLVPTDEQFLAQLRELTAERGVLLIFDEVITGFRVHPGGAQGAFGIRPDLTTLAKILAGGLPGGCLAGRADVLTLLEFSNRTGQKMPHPGTFNANPLSASAGIATLKKVADGRPAARANEIARKLRVRLNELFARRGVRWVCYGRFSDFYIFPAAREVPEPKDYRWPDGASWQELATAAAPPLRFAFRLGMLLNGVDVPGLRGMSHAAHTEEDVERTADAVDATLELLADAGLL